jgi:hypothetical protein
MYSPLGSISALMIGRHRIVRSRAARLKQSVRCVPMMSMLCNRLPGHGVAYHEVDRMPGLWPKIAV